MRKLITFLVVTACCLFFRTAIGTAQEITCNVNVNMEQLGFESRSYVSTLADDLENYINSQKFGDEDWKGDKIPVEINIYLSGGTNQRYGARLFIIAKRNLVGGGQSVLLKMKDDKWSFTYGSGANFTYSTLRFDELRSLIDFYMLLICGFDKDLYGELDGTQYFERAKSVVQLGSSASAEGYSTQSQLGDFTRFNLVSELTDMRYEDMRKLFFSYYLDGLDVLSEDKAKGTKAIDDFVYYLAKFKKEKMVGPSVVMQLFFDTKAQELASIFKDYSEKSVFKNLIYLDPGNTVLYQETEEGK